MTAAPSPVYLTAADGSVLATASGFRPPGPREALWAWRAVYTDPVKGTREWISLGRLSDSEVPQALRTKIAAACPGLVSSDSSGIHTLDAVVESWAAWCKSRGPGGAGQIAHHTVAVYVANARRLLPFIRGIDIREMSRAKYRAIREAMDAAGGARRTVNSDSKGLVQAMIWGREQGIPIPVFDTKGITTLRITESHDTNNHRTPTYAEVQAVFDGMRTTPSRLALFLAWRTGARIGEVCKWTPDVGLPVDEDGQCWVYLPHRKNGGSGLIPITVDDRNVILSLLPAKWTRLGVAAFTEALASNASGTWATACVRVGVEPFTPHGLRRLMDDTMLRRGVELGTYADIMDHTPETALRHYRRPNRDDRIGALAKMRSRGEPLARWLAARGMTEDDALAVLKAHVGQSDARPGLRLVEN